MDKLKKTAAYSFDLLRGSCIILACHAIGKLLSPFTQGLLSGSILGMILLFLLLALGVVKKEHVSKVAEFLINNLVLFFIPALVGVTLLDFSSISANLIDILLITIASTIMVMASTGLFVQWCEKRSKKREETK